MQKINNNYIKLVVQKALAEDLSPRGDLTTKLIDSKNKIVTAKIIAKQNGVISGLDFCKAAFKLIGTETLFKKKVKDGEKIKKNKVIAEIKAKTKTILSAERTALNFLNHASGIATLTNQFTKKIRKKTKICCTRKTTPNLRPLEKYAVKKGGGYNHRYNLSDEILIKDNHIRASNNLRDLVKKAIKTKKIITVEIENLNQLKQVMGLKFKRILFDNMSLKHLKKCLKVCKNMYQTEYSGNANLKNISKDDIYYPQEVTKKNEEMDAVVFSVDRNFNRPILEWEKSTAIHKEKNEIYSIGYPNGLPIKVALNASITENENYFYYYTSLDSFQGNSGSPVFNFYTNKVIGVLVSGEIDYRFNGSCYEIPSCAYPYCKGEKVMRMEEIVRNFQ